MEMGVITQGPGYSWKRINLVPCRLSVQAIGLSVCPNNTPTNEQT